jgi:pyridinium-3,5-bisthiocarboxylic acid mononucleotide nickel chelatase
MMGGNRPLFWKAVRPYQPFSGMKVVYFDCFSGLSGDMTLGALLACGADENDFRRALENLRVPGYNLHIRRRNVEGLMATDVDVELLEADQGHGRHLSDIADIYEKSDLSPQVRENAFAIFTRLAEAEAKVHGTTPDAIHFHEVGAVDAIVDITGTCILLEMLGIEAVYASPLPMSRGFVDCQHGRMPLPAPATVELLMGLPAYPVSVRGELVTPTGAAILATLAGPERFGEPPAMTPRAVGYGSGKKDFGAPFPNLLRVIIGDTAPGSTAGTRSAVNADGTPTTVVVLETNVDDATPEVLGYAQERLFAQGALDVYFVAAQMKKNRPGTVVTVLSSHETADALTQTLLEETGSFGVRRTVAERSVLERTAALVETPYGTVRVKIGTQSGKTIAATPEYEDCRRLAVQSSVPLREVYRAAASASSVLPIPIG